MKILITEDDPKKLRELEQFLRKEAPPSAEILTASNMVEFNSKFGPDVAICLIDIRLPAYDGGEPHQNGIGILQSIKLQTSGSTRLLAVSSYPEEFSELRPQFESAGCILLDFQDKSVWQSTLRTLIVQASQVETLDFIIFTALPEERAPYTMLQALKGESVGTGHLNRYDIKIGRKKGSVIELPNMGLVNAAVTAAICIDRFSPRIVAMSGICGGFVENAGLGQLLISERSYEYQTGKWSRDGFAREPYQYPISEATRVKLRRLLDDQDLSEWLEKGWRGSRPSAPVDPKLAIFTSGSAVIADKSILDQVRETHRKVAGLDMEIHAIHQAAQLSACRPDVICAKVVVDLADANKDDRLHGYGSYVSAKFVVKAVADALDERLQELH